MMTEVEHTIFAIAAMLVETNIDPNRASAQQPLSPLRRVVLSHTKRSAEKKASLRCVDDRLREKKLDYEESSARLQL